MIKVNVILNIKNTGNIFSQDIEIDKSQLDNTIPLDEAVDKFLNEKLEMFFKIIE